jgi:hypothetical protein
MSRFTLNDTATHKFSVSLQDENCFYRYETEHDPVFRRVSVSQLPNWTCDALVTSTPPLEFQRLCLLHAEVRRFLRETRYISKMTTGAQIGPDHLTTYQIESIANSAKRSKHYLKFMPGRMMVRSRRDNLPAQALGWQDCCKHCWMCVKTK